MIPKVIHQIWLGDQSNRPTPLMETWRDMNPSMGPVMDKRFWKKRRF